MNKFNFGKKKEGKPDKALEKAKDLHDKTLEEARLCLHSVPFKKFIAQYEEVERKTIDSLISYSKTEHDPLKFGQVAKDLLIHLAHCKVMLDTVHVNAGEKYGYSKDT